MTPTSSFLWHYTGETRPLWNNEFFNRSVHDVYTVDGPDPADGGLPETPVVERADGTLVTAARVAPRVRYAVSYVDIAGKPLARDAQLGLTLFRVDGPMVILTRVRGVYPRHVGRPRGHLPARALQRRQPSPCASAPTSTSSRATQTVTATENGRVVGAHAHRARRAADARRPAAPRRARQLHRHVHRGEAAQRRAAGDTRRLGAHYYSFDYRR